MAAPPFFRPFISPRRRGDGCEECADIARTVRDRDQPAACRRQVCRGIVLDMDSSVSPTHGEQEMNVWNGHYARTLLSPAVRETKRAGKTRTLMPVCDSSGESRFLRPDVQDDG